jgi:hypothetical protein
MDWWRGSVLTLCLGVPSNLYRRRETGTLKTKWKYFEGFVSG